PVRVRGRDGAAAAQGTELDDVRVRGRAFGLFFDHRGVRGGEREHGFAGSGGGPKGNTVPRVPAAIVPCFWTWIVHPLCSDLCAPPVQPSSVSTGRPPAS